MLLESKEYRPKDTKNMIKYIIEKHKLTESDIMRILNANEDDYRQFIEGTFHAEYYIKLLLLYTYSTTALDERLRALILHIKTELHLSTDNIANLAGIPADTLQNFIENSMSIEAEVQCQLFSAANTLLSILHWNT